MATEAQVVCDTFVRHYYKMLVSNPQEVHKLYEDSSTFSRQDASGVLSTVSTIDGINVKIMSLNDNERKLNVKSADAVESHHGGVLILVTGSVLGLEFAQTFYLARREEEYFVLTDMFRYIGGGEPKETASKEEELLGSQLSEDQPPEVDSAAQAPTIQTNPKPVVMKNSSQSNLAAAATASQVQANIAEQEAIPEKSFADVVKQERAKLPPTNVAKVASSPVKTTAAALQGGRDHSIYLSGLPLNLTPSLLEEECRKFGDVCPNGVQVKTTQDGFSFGFVAFLQESSVQKALQASPIAIKGKRVYVQIKKGAPNGAAGTINARGGYIGGSGRDGYHRNESYRGRQNTVNARGGYIGGSGRDGYHRNESFRGRQNTGNGGGYSGGANQRGYNSDAGGASLRHKNRPNQPKGRNLVAPNRRSS